MRFDTRDIDQRRRRGRLRIAGDTFACVLETDWATQHRGVYPRWLSFCGVAMPHLKFGFAKPWEYILDLDASEGEAGLVVTSQGYESLTGRRIPFARTRRFFFHAPEMLYEISESQHLLTRQYGILGIDPASLEVDPMLHWARYRRDGVCVSWQFHPRPVFAQPEAGGWQFEFETGKVETLIQWAREVDGPPPAIFVSISDEVGALSVSGPRGERRFAGTCKHEGVEPDEQLVLPPGELIFTGDGPRPCLAELAVRRMDRGQLHLGATRVLLLKSLAESPSFPMFKPSLVRTLRSLRERMVFNAMPEDDPGELYQWGAGTWARCVTVLALDRWGFSREAYQFLEFMLDASQQFVASDGDPHLWDNFYVTGPKWNDRLYDINAHSMKLYEAGKFYLAHRQDSFGEKLRGEHFETLRRWCVWIERHMAADGAVLDETESNVWAHGYGTFTQAPAAAGVKLFATLARDAGREDVAEQMEQLVERLMNGLNTRLWGDAANSYLDIPAGVGSCYLNYVPRTPTERNWWDQPVHRIGISCYSLAAAFFLQDPDVALLSPDDPRATETLDLALQHLGDPFDQRITTWHIRRKEAHMGYGPGQLLVALLYTGRGEEFRRRLAGVFDVSTREIGDAYLLQEVLGRVGHPNRGNKSVVSCFPFMAALLAGFDGPLLADRVKACLPDLVVRSETSA
ncbi:MAG: hypothetical protein IT440_00835 [Phycisphaeraceae bacterium]|nr:hypothetical protein [Phycisphaeraceae bacterium]